MKEMEYSYCVVRYVHNPVAGEMLNVGVMVCAPAASFCAVRLDYRYERLARTFANFEGPHFERVLRQLEAAVQQAQTDAEPIKDVATLGSRLWPDSDLSFQFGQMSAGLTDNPIAALELLYERMVLSQQAREVAEKRTNDEVWMNYQTTLSAGRQQPAIV